MLCGWFWQQRGCFAEDKTVHRDARSPYQPSWRRGLLAEWEEGNNWAGICWEHRALCQVAARAGDVPGCCSVGVSAFFPCIKLQSLEEHRCLSKSRKIGSGRNLLHIPFIHISLLTGVVKTSQKLLYSTVAAEKALVSRRVTFALRCAYIFIVYQGRE